MIRILQITAALTVSLTPLAAFAQASSASGGSSGGWGDSWGCQSSNCNSGGAGDHTVEFIWGGQANNNQRGADANMYTDTELSDSTAGIANPAGTDTAGAGDISSETDAGYGYQNTGDAAMPGDLQARYDSGTNPGTDSSPGGNVTEGMPAGYNDAANPGTQGQNAMGNCDDSVGQQGGGGTTGFAVYNCGMGGSAGAR